MTANEEIREHQARCQPHMLRLRMLARGDYGPMPTAAEVAQATGAIIAEVAAGSLAASSAAGYRQAQPGGGTFLQVRLNRLSAAAEEAIAAARDGNTTLLGRVLLRFEALTTAIWTVQHAMYVSSPGTDSGQAAAETTALSGKVR